MENSLGSQVGKELSSVLQFALNCTLSAAGLWFLGHVWCAVGSAPLFGVTELKPTYIKRGDSGFIRCAQKRMWQILYFFVKHNHLPFLLKSSLKISWLILVEQERMWC